MTMKRPLFSAIVFAGLVFGVSLSARSEVEQGPVLLQKVEARRGQPLTPEQRRQFARTAASLFEALLPPRQKFARSIARTFKLPEGEVQAMLPVISGEIVGFDNGVIRRIEARLDRAVMSQELQQMRVADNASQAEMNEILSRYADELGQVAGLSKEQIRRLMPTMGI